MASYASWVTSNPVAAKQAEDVIRTLTYLLPVKPPRCGTLSLPSCRFGAWRVLARSAGLSVCLLVARFVWMRAVVSLCCVYARAPSAGVVQLAVPLRSPSTLPAVVAGGPGSPGCAFCVCDVIPHHHQGGPLLPLLSPRSARFGRAPPFSPFLPRPSLGFPVLE